jgi:hypothetical protein
MSRKGQARLPAFCSEMLPFLASETVDAFKHGSPHVRVLEPDSNTQNGSGFTCNGSVWQLGRRPRRWKLIVLVREMVKAMDMQSRRLKSIAVLDQVFLDSGWIRANLPPYPLNHKPCQICKVQKFYAVLLFPFRRLRVSNGLEFTANLKLQLGEPQANSRNKGG